MTTRQKTPGSPFLYDSVTGDLVGLKDDDGSETLQGMSGSVNSGGLQWGDTALPLFIDGGSGKSYSGLVDGSDSVRGLASRITVNPDVMGDPAYMVDYDPAGGSARVTNHQWVAEFELERADSAS